MDGLTETIKSGFSGELQLSRETVTDFFIVISALDTAKSKMTIRTLLVR